MIAMNDFLAACTELKLNPKALTIGDSIEIAEKLKCKVSHVVVAEASQQTNLSTSEVLDQCLQAYAHNIHAAEIGADYGQSFIMGTVGKELSAPNAPKLIDDTFVNTILVHTLSAQVGNHEVGLEPCAGTGDSCPYTGFIMALRSKLQAKAKTAKNPEQQAAQDHETLGYLAALINKIGSLFRVGKTTTGCNMEGYGAGSAALSAAFTELEGGSPSQLGMAMVLALSPTIGNPCTPRVMVPGLCATHIGGAVLGARLASSLVLHSNLRVTVPVDVMLAMAAAIHPISATSLVPEVIKYMEPFFKTHAGVENYILPEIKAAETKRINDILATAKEQTRQLAQKARPIVKPFGLAVVGGSSQAVGSPTNAGRIAHALHQAQGFSKPTKVIIELYAELFARRGINVPGILMAAVYGSDTTDGDTYRVVMDKIAADNIKVDILTAPNKQQQKITLVCPQGQTMLDSLNRGGARLVITDSSLGLAKAKETAQNLGIEVVEA